MSVEPSSPRWPMSRPVTRSLGRDLNREQEIVEHEVSQRRQSFGMSTPPRSGSAERLFLANPLYRSVGDDNPSTYEGHVANDNGSPDNEIQFGNIHQNTAEGPGPEAISSISRSAMGTASSTTGRAPAEDDVLRMTSKPTYVKNLRASREHKKECNKPGPWSKKHCSGA